MIAAWNNVNSMVNFRIGFTLTVGFSFNECSAARYLSSLKKDPSMYQPARANIVLLINIIKEKNLNKKTIWYRKSHQLHLECNACFVRNFKIIMDFKVFKTSKLGVLKLEYILISAYIAVLNFLIMF